MLRWKHCLYKLFLFSGYENRNRRRRGGYNCGRIQQHCGNAFYARDKQYWGERGRSAARQGKHWNTLNSRFSVRKFLLTKVALRIFCCWHHQVKRYICVKDKNVLGFIILCFLAKTFVLLHWLYDFFIRFWAFQKKLSTISSWIVFPYIQMPKLYFILHNESIQKYGFRCTILYQNFVCLKIPNSKYFYRIFTSGDQNFLNSIYHSLFNSGFILIISEYFALRYSSVKKVEYTSSKRGKWWYCVLKFSSRF